MSINKKQINEPLKRAKGRLIFTGIVLFFGFLSIAFRLADLTLVKYWQEDEPQLVERVEKNFHNRADIIDSQGIVLASSVKVSSVYANPKLIRHPEKLAKKLVNIFPTLDEATIREKLSSKKHFVWIKRHATPKQKYAVNKLGEPGLAFQDEYKRLYPYGEIVSHIVGYTDIDNKGLSGIEKAHDHELIQNTKPLRLTIDSRLQHIVRDELSKAIKKFNAKGGTAIIMEAKTGRISSLVSLPDFDPHNMQETNPDQLFNKGSLGVYEMGSTFKIFSVAAGLEFTNLKLSDEIDCRDPIQYGRFTISDYHAQKRAMTVPEVFIHSSNIGHVKIAEKVGTEKFKSFLQELGFFDRLSVNLQEKGRPITPEIWRDINTATASYGHGIAVTPLHLVSAATTMVNGGYQITPQLIYKETERGPSLVSKRTSTRVNEMLRLTVLEGTGKNADVEGYLVGGKTGTAEKNSKGKYNQSALISSFLGAFPMSDPKYVVYLMVDEPIGNQQSYGYATGGWVAAPAVKNIIRRMTSLMGIPPFTHEQTRSFDLSMQVNRVPRKKMGETKIAAH